ncbi:MAG: asparagine synthase-related protein [Terriglobales bacterium]|jgi:asparagine synthase (glutamine-hydrolysing)
MSVQFGRWNFEGQPPAPDYIEKVSATLAPYGPDSNESYSKGGVKILYRAFHTTKESHREKQPHISSSGAVITWDGRLDNRAELISELSDSLTNGSTDVAIVAMAFERWGANCFAKLIGDWALSIWNPGNRSLILAKDPIGTRHLCYSFDNNQVTWSTILDPLVRLAGKTFALNEEYIAGWFSIFPAVDLTPCVGIHSVPPSSFVLLRPGRHTVSRYWNFDPQKKIRYRTDAEYEEHFRTVFATAVQRNLRSDRPVLAELSGGRDSSSIVCMADTIIVRGTADTPRLDTISYYDDSEPNWNERPYFTKVEEKRGRTGWHVNVGAQDPEKIPPPEPPPESLHSRFVPSPGCDGRTSPQIRMCMASQGNHVVLSGIGGDEVMGGVPIPAPELENLLARAQFGALAHQLKVWALEKRKPWFHLLWEAARGFFPPALVGVPKYMRPAPWLQSTFVKRHWAALTGYPSRTKLFGSLPSFQDNISTLDALRRQLARTALPFEPPFEKRYPYLDRGLLEFMFAIPREQLVRPTQRRSLMRRALVGIVPDEILNRKGKAFVVRAPLVRISKDWASLVEMTQDLVSSSLGIVDAERLIAILQKGRRGEEIPAVPLMRTLSLEGWLRNLRSLGTINLDTRLKPELAWQASTQG